MNVFITSYFLIRAVGCDDWLCWDQFAECPEGAIVVQTPAREIQASCLSDPELYVVCPAPFGGISSNGERAFCGTIMEFKRTNLNPIPPNHPSSVFRDSFE